MAAANKYQIYALQCPMTHDIRYVGKTCSGMRRIRRHWYRWELEHESNGYKKNWITKLLRFGLKPIVLILQTFTSAEHLEAAESYWIDYFDKLGCRLTNILKSANNFFRDRDAKEWKRRVVAGIKRTRKERAASLKKYYQDNPEAAAERGAFLKSITSTKEWKESHSKHLSERWKDPTYSKRVGKAISKAKKGVPLSEEGRQAVFEASLRRAKPVWGMELKTGKIQHFLSKKQAGRVMGGQVHDINKVLSGQYKQLNGWVFALTEEELPSKS